MSLGLSPKRKRVYIAAIRSGSARLKEAAAGSWVAGAREQGAQSQEGLCPMAASLTASKCGAPPAALSLLIFPLGFSFVFPRKTRFIAPRLSVADDIYGGASF